MENWQISETECLNYLKQNFSDKHYNFEAKGGSDSKQSDILLTKNGITMFYIESKMSKAQCGQFVTFPNNDTKTFEYSNSNLYPQNIQSTVILNKMTENFDRYKNPGTAGTELFMDKSYFYSWINEFYKRKKVKYFIIEKEVGKNNMNTSNFIIFPIEHFPTYFDVTALYRCKKSGSSNPSEKYFPEIEYALQSEGVSVNRVYKNGKYAYAEINAEFKTRTITYKTHSYQLKHENTNVYKVTKLSNTSNPNVIFSISLIKDQNESDLEEFKKEFNYADKDFASS